MSNKTVIKTIVATVFLFFCINGYSKTDPLLNVSFGDVMAMPFAEPSSTFRYGEENDQYVLAWGAHQKDTIHPLLPGVLLVHGGCWLKQYDVNHIKPLASALSEKGYNVFAIEYRRTGQAGGGWPGSAADVRDAMKTVREAYPKMALTAIGHSAGGHLAMLSSTDPTLQLTAVIGLAAITDLVEYSKGTNSCQQATASFMGGTAKEKPRAYEAATTINKQIVAPLFLLNGTADNIVPADQNKHRQSRRFTGDGIGHFDWIHPQSAAYQHLLNTLARLYE